MLSLNSVIRSTTLLFVVALACPLPFHFLFTLNALPMVFILMFVKTNVMWFRDRSSGVGERRSALIYIYIYIVEEGLDGHGLLLLRVSRVMRSSDNWLSDDRITRETLSNNNPCPSSPSSTILRSAYMALNTLQQDWLL